MSDKEWDQVTEVHLKGAFACTKAAWPLFRKQKFGRVINTASAAGLYGTRFQLVSHSRSYILVGNFGQANYSAAKMGLIGFTKTLAREGAKYGISNEAIIGACFLPAGVGNMSTAISGLFLHSL